MPKKTAKQMRLFTMRAERERKRRDRRRARVTAERRAKSDASGEPKVEPVQLDLIDCLGKLDSPN